MKLTTKEYLLIFGGKSKDAITEKCRKGELDAEKNEKGAWVINVPVPIEVYEASLKVSELAKKRDAIYREYIKINKEIERLMTIKLSYINGEGSV